MHGNCVEYKGSDYSWAFQGTGTKKRNLSTALEGSSMCLLLSFPSALVLEAFLSFSMWESHICFSLFNFTVLLGCNGQTASLSSRSRGPVIKWLTGENMWVRHVPVGFLGGWENWLGLTSKLFLPSRCPCRPLHVHSTLSGPEPPGPHPQGRSAEVTGVGGQAFPRHCPTHCPAFPKSQSRMRTSWSLHPAFSHVSPVHADP